MNITNLFTDFRNPTPKRLCEMATTISDEDFFDWTEDVHPVDILETNLPDKIFDPWTASTLAQAEASLGLFDKLPLELLLLILPWLDCNSLMAFRRINRGAYGIVESFSSFVTVRTHIPGAIRSIMAADAGEWITCDQLMAALHDPKCEQCGDVTGYFNILRRKRVCWFCFAPCENEQYSPLLYSHAIRKFGISRSIISTLPHMRTVPGIYGPFNRTVSKSVSLVDFESARQAGIALYGSSDAMLEHVSKVLDRKLQVFDAKKRERERRHSRRDHAARPRPPTVEDPWDSGEAGSLRFFAIIRMPWLDRSSDILQYGFRCAGCLEEREGRYEGSLSFRREHNEGSFAEHIRKRGRIITVDPNYRRKCHVQNDD